MPKSIKLQDGTYLDDNSIVDENHYTLEEMLLHDGLYTATNYGGVNKKIFTNSRIVGENTNVDLNNFIDPRNL